MAIRGLDGYRAIAFKCGGKVHLRSRNGKDFNSRYSAIVKALAGLPDEPVIDGEVVALDASGRPSFSALQNHASGETPIVYYVFDALIIAGQDVMSEPLKRRQELLSSRVLSRLVEPIRESPVLEASLFPSDPVREGARARRYRGQARRQPLRARATLRRVAEDAG